MSSGSQPNTQDADGLEAAVDQDIAACGATPLDHPRADCRERISGIRGDRTDEGRLSRLCAREVSYLLRLGEDHDGSNLLRGAALRRCGRWHCGGEPTECFNPVAVVMRAEALSRKPGHVGAVAFSRTGDPATGEFGDAKIIKKFGEVPDDLSTL